MSGFLAGLAASFALLCVALIGFGFNALAGVTFLVSLTMTLGAVFLRKGRPQ